MQNGGTAGDDPRLRELIGRQNGVVSRAQALDVGISPGTIRRRLDAGRWQRLRPGVFATFSGPIPRLSQLWAVVLAAGPGAVLSHETAAEVEGLVDEPSGTIHVTVPATRTVRRMPGVRVHRSVRLERTRHPAHEPPRTRVEETVIDLTQTCRSVADAYGWIARAVNARLTTVDRLLRAVHGRPRLRHRRLLLEGLGDVDVGCRSVLEIAYLRDVERAHGLPRGERQASVPRAGGRGYLDVIYRRHRVRVELDGRAAHPAHRRFRDMSRDNDAVEAGDAPLRYGTVDVTQRPCRVAWQIAGVLRRGGWRGTPRRCGRSGCGGA